MCRPSYGFCGMPFVALMFVYTARKKFFFLITKMYWNKNEKHLNKNEQKSRDAATKKEQIQEE